MLATGSQCFDVKTKRVLTEPQQLSTAVLTSFSKFVEGLPIQRTLNYTGQFSGHKSLNSAEQSDFLGDLRVDDVLWIAIVPKYFLDPSFTPLSLRLAQIIRTRCTNVDIRHILRLWKLKNFHLKYWPLKVGLRYARYQSRYLFFRHRHQETVEKHRL